MASREDSPEIVVTRDGIEVMRRSLDRSPIRLGRRHDNDLVLDDPSVSDEHAVIVCESGRWSARCINPQQRLRVAGSPCRAHALSDGDRIGLGPFEILFHTPTRFDLPSGPASSSEEGFSLGRTRMFDASDSLDVHDGGPDAPNIRIPGYEITREVGRGGMGRVFQAVQISTRRTVALKILLEGPFTNEKTKRRFEREVHIVASLRHPNIAQIYESGLHEGRYWFAMEFVDGQPLDAPELVAGLSLRDRLALMATVCEAVGSAHDQMIVHRDLKPSNILISKDGEPHILDFGLAKVEDPKRDPEMMLSMAGELMGTPAYMSPEQTDRDPSKVDVRTDVYSLGVILYHLLTGQFPYDVRGRLDEVIREIATADPTRPSQISKEVDSEAEAILLKAIAKDPGERYSSAKQMGRDLRRLLAGEPIEAKLSSRSYVLTKTLTRNRRLLIAVGVLAVAVVTSVLVTRAWFAPPSREPPSDKGAVITAQVPHPSRPVAQREGGPKGAGPTHPSPATRSAATPSATTTAPESPHAGTPTARPTVASSPAAMPAETKERQAQTWLANLASFVAQGDHLRAHLAIERLNSRFSDVPAVVQSADRLKRFSEQIERKLGPGTLHDKMGYVLHSPPPNTADWQAAMTIAQEMVAEEDNVGIVVVRVMLENEKAEGGFEVRGRGLSFYGRGDVAARLQVKSGDILFVGSKPPHDQAPSMTIVTTHHHSPTIPLNPRQGAVTRFGDVVVREKRR